jgi:serine/threonine protein kinase
MIGRARPQDAPYLAPEVFRGEPFSKATDVYAFGLLMWELYTGQPAFASFANTPLKVRACGSVRVGVYGGAEGRAPSRAPGLSCPPPHPPLGAQVLQTVVSDGGRPVFPEGTPAWCTSLAMRCWAGQPRHRPSLRRILAQLQPIEEETGAAGA